jgi:hypothetical protein
MSEQRARMAILNSTPPSAKALKILANGQGRSRNEINGAERTETSQAVPRLFLQHEAGEEKRSAVFVGPADLDWDRHRSFSMSLVRLANF